MITDGHWRELLWRRAEDPGSIRRAYQARKRRNSLLNGKSTLFLVAADHPARGALGVGGDPMAMADRRSLLARLLTALANPDVDGVLGTPDVIEDLLLLDGLNDRVVIGSMNRGGLAGADWEIDDRFTAYDASSIATFGLDGGKMLLRLVDSDPGTIPTLEGCARAVTELAEHGLMAMVEPLPYKRDHNGKLVLQKDSAALSRASAVAAGLGSTSAYTWLKLPAPEEPEIVLDTTALPALVLGGVPSANPQDDLASWGRSLGHPTVRGLVVGRALLYPPDGDVASAVAAAAEILRTAKGITE